MPEQEHTPPLLFISYSHEAPGHLQRVLELCESLRALGFDCRLDQHEAFPSQGWCDWSREMLDRAACVLVVCSSEYVDTQQRGEDSLWHGPVLPDVAFDRKDTRFVPVLFNREDLAWVPQPLRQASHFHLSDERGMELLGIYLSEKLSPSGGVSPSPLPVLPRLQDFPAPLPLKKPWLAPYVPSGHFVGRSKELRKLASICERRKCLTLSAPSAGLGRRQLVFEHLARKGEVVSAVVWLQWGNARFLCHELARALETLPRGEDEDGRPDELDATSMARVLAGRLARCTGWLLVLDNWPGGDDPFRTLLQGLVDCKDDEGRLRGTVLHLPPPGEELDGNDLGGGEELELSPLPEKDILTLLRSRTGRRAFMSGERNAALFLGDLWQRMTSGMDALGVLAERTHSSFRDLQTAFKDVAPERSLEVLLKRTASQSPHHLEELLWLCARLTCLGAGRLPVAQLASGVEAATSRDGAPPPEVLLAEAEALGLLQRLEAEDTCMMLRGFEDHAESLVRLDEQEELLLAFSAGVEQARPSVLEARSVRFHLWQAVRSALRLEPLEPPPAEEPEPDVNRDLSGMGLAPEDDPPAALHEALHEVLGEEPPAPALDEPGLEHSAMSEEVGEQDRQDEPIASVFSTSWEWRGGTHDDAPDYPDILESEEPSEAGAYSSDEGALAMAASEQPHDDEDAPPPLEPTPDDDDLDPMRQALAMVHGLRREALQCRRRPGGAQQTVADEPAEVSPSDDEPSAQNDFVRLPSPCLLIGGASSGKGSASAEQGGDEADMDEDSPAARYRALKKAAEAKAAAKEGKGSPRGRKKRAKKRAERSSIKKGANSSFLAALERFFFWGRRPIVSSGSTAPDDVALSFRAEPVEDMNGRGPETFDEPAWPEFPRSDFSGSDLSGSDSSEPDSPLLSVSPETPGAMPEEDEPVPKADAEPSHSEASGQETPLEGDGEWGFAPAAPEDDLESAATGEAPDEQWPGPDAEEGGTEEQGEEPAEAPDEIASEESVEATAEQPPLEPEPEEPADDAIDEGAAEPEPGLDEQIRGEAEPEGLEEQSSLEVERPRAPSVRPADSEPDLQATAAECLKRAEMYCSQGMLPEAEPFYARALQLYEKLHGPEHLEVARVANAFGEIYKQQGDFDQAEPYLERALAIRVEVWGDEHLEVAQSCTNLGSLRMAQGRRAEAEALYVRALRMDEVISGPEHPNTATDCNNLAVLYFGVERFAEALRNIKRAIAIRETVLGEGHPHHVQACENCAAILRKLGRSREAQEVMMRTRSMRGVAEGQAPSHEPGQAGGDTAPHGELYGFSGPSEGEEPAGNDEGEKGEQT